MGKDNQQAIRAAIRMVDRDFTVWTTPVAVEIKPIHLLGLISQVVLALQHPDNKGVSADMSRKTVRSFFQIFDALHLQIPPELRTEWKRVLDNHEEKNETGSNRSEGP